MRKSLEQQLRDKCSELNIFLDINKDRITVDVLPPRMFNTTLAHWDYCVIPSERDLSLDRSTKYSYDKERNDSIRLILEAIETIYELEDGQKCGNEFECEECYPE